MADDDARGPVRNDQVGAFFRLEPAALDDSVGVFRALHGEAPVTYVAERDLWVVTGYDAVREAAGRPEDFSSHDVTGIRLPPHLPHALLNADPPDHTRHKRLVGRAFSPAVVAAAEPLIRELVVASIESWIDRGEVEFVGEFALQFPVYTIARLLGVPARDRDRFVGWAFAHIAPIGNPHLDRDERAAVQRQFAEFEAYFLDVLAERRVRPDDYFVSLMVARSDDGTVPLADGEMIEVLRQLLTGGIETTAKLLTSAWEMLLAHPDQLEALRADPSLVPAMLEETLRYKAPVRGMFRTARRDTELGGCPVPADAMLMLSFASAGRDGTHFPEPDTYDIRRPDAERHLSFGAGVHRCIGLGLGRLQARVAFEELLARLDDVRLSPTNRFEPFPSYVIQGLGELHLTFDKRDVIAP